MNERFVANMAQKGGKEKPDLVSWYADLNRCGQTQEYEKAIKIAGRSKCCKQNSTLQAYCFSLLCFFCLWHIDKYN